MRNVIKKSPFPKDRWTTTGKDEDGTGPSNRRLDDERLRLASIKYTVFWTFTRIHSDMLRHEGGDVNITRKVDQIFIDQVD